MIAGHQPKHFPSNIRVVVSSCEDGNIKYLPNEPHEYVTENRIKLFKKAAMNMDKAQLVRIDYDRTDFCRYAVADSNNGGVSLRPDFRATTNDALATNKPDQALFLPIADCCALALADIKQNVIMLSHVGRHSAEQEGARKSVEFMQTTYGTDPQDIVAWLSPAAGRKIPLYNLENKGLQQVVVEQLEQAGVPVGRVEICDVDTTEHTGYFSHSEFLKGRRPSDGRFAVIMTIQP